MSADIESCQVFIGLPRELFPPPLTLYNLSDLRLHLLVMYQIASTPTLLLNFGLSVSDWYIIIVGYVETNQVTFGPMDQWAYGNTPLYFIISHISETIQDTLNTLMEIQITG